MKREHGVLKTGKELSIDDVFSHPKSFLGKIKHKM